MPLETPSHADPLRLHRDHPVTVGFFDETGAIASDRFFTVGLLRADDHSELLKQVRELRRRFKFWEEFKWHGITDANKHIYKALIDLLVEDPTVHFSCFVSDRHVADPVARFGNTFAAYEKLAIQLAIGSVKPYELMTVIADNYSAPNDRNFQAAVRDECNSRLRRLVLVSVVQVDSQATEGLQLVDILIGAVGFEFKANCGLASHEGHRGEVAAYMRTRCGTSTFNLGFVGPNVNVKIYEHDRWLKREQARVAAGQSVSGEKAKARPKRRRSRRRRPSANVAEQQPTAAVANEPAASNAKKPTRRGKRGGRGRGRRS